MKNAEKKLVGKRGVKDWAEGERKKDVKGRKEERQIYFQFRLDRTNLVNLIDASI